VVSAELAFKPRQEGAITAVRSKSQIIHLEFEIMLSNYSINVPLCFPKLSVIELATHFPHSGIKKWDSFIIFTLEGGSAPHISLSFKNSHLSTFRLHHLHNGTVCLGVSVYFHKEYTSLCILETAVESC
jgi:hypothetical protein